MEANSSKKTLVFLVCILFEISESVWIPPCYSVVKRHKREPPKKNIFYDSGKSESRVKITKLHRANDEKLDSKEKNKDRSKENSAGFVVIPTNNSTHPWETYILPPVFDFSVFDKVQHTMTDAQINGKITKPDLEQHAFTENVIAHNINEPRLVSDDNINHINDLRETVQKMNISPPANIQQTGRWAYNGSPIAPAYTTLIKPTNSVEFHQPQQFYAQTNPHIQHLCKQIELNAKVYSLLSQYVNSLGNTMMHSTYPMYSM